jgi:hypothetical protein
MCVLVISSLTLSTTETLASGVKSCVYIALLINQTIIGHLAIVSCVHFFNGNHFLVRAQRGIQYHPSKMGMSQLNKLSF